MKQFKTATWWIMAAVAGASRMFAVTPEPASNRFQNIAIANIFRLHAPVEQKAVEAPKPMIYLTKLTGLMEFGGRIRALLEVTFPPVSLGPPRPICMTLGPGDKLEPVEVLRIDMDTQTVLAKVCGVLTNLTFERNAASAPVVRSAVSAAPRRPNTGSLPGVQPEPQLGRDETALVIEAERERLRQAGDPQSNLMPITHLTPAGAPGTEALSDQAKLPDGSAALPVRKRALQPH